MKEILFLVPNDSLGGAEQVLKMIASYYLKSHDEVYVLFLKRRYTNGWENIKQDNLHLLYGNANTEKAGLLYTIFNLFKLINHRFDYVYTSHVHLTGFVGLFIRLGIIKKKKFIGRESTSIFNRFTGGKLLEFKLMYSLGYKPVDLLICQTDYMKTQLINALPWLNSKIRTMANPVNLDHINMESLETLPKEEQVKYGNYIITAGRLIPEKGFDILIKSFKRLKEKYPDLKLLILGEGKERENLVELIRKLKLGEDVILKGFVSNVYPYFKNAGLCVVSSRIEGFPNVLLQMMSQNTKIVSTRCAGGIESLNGIFTCDVNDVTGLTTTILECFDADTTTYGSKFEKELDKRTINKYVATVEQYLNEK